MGSADTKYLNAQTDDRSKRGAIGTYFNSGLSQYTNVNSEKSPQANASIIDHSLIYTEGSYFPANWDPRYTLFSGLGADPDRRENYQVHKNGARTPAVNISGFPSNDYFVNYKDAVSGFIVNGTLSTDNSQGVHSLTDVPVFASGPCSDTFAGVYNSIDIFYKMANCFGLSVPAGRLCPASRQQQQRQAEHFLVPCVVPPVIPSSSSKATSSSAASVVTPRSSSSAIVGPVIVSTPSVVVSTVKITSLATATTTQVLQQLIELERAFYQRHLLAHLIVLVVDQAEQHDQQLVEDEHDFALVEQYVRQLDHEGVEQHEIEVLSARIHVDKSHERKEFVSRCSSTSQTGLLAHALGNGHGVVAFVEAQEKQILSSPRHVSVASAPAHSSSSNLGRASLVLPPDYKISQYRTYLFCYHLTCILVDLATRKTNSIHRTSQMPSTRATLANHAGGYVQGVAASTFKPLVMVVANATYQEIKEDWPIVKGSIKNWFTKAHDYFADKKAKKQAAKKAKKMKKEQEKKAKKEQKEAQKQQKQQRQEKKKANTDKAAARDGVEHLQALRDNLERWDIAIHSDPVEAGASNTAQLDVTTSPMQAAPQMSSVGAAHILGFDTVKMDDGSADMMVPTYHNATSLAGRTRLISVGEPLPFGTESGLAIVMALYGVIFTAFVFFVCWEGAKRWTRPRRRTAAERDVLGIEV
ncbi:hypothetical protein MRB53_037392 [Persea americana]|nr:hypothetical protein MRB53_037392 [Persea americana]